MELTQENFILLIVSGTFVLVLLALAFIWLTIRNFKNRMQQQREVFKIVMEAQEKERHRISRDLHEGIGADISAIKLLTGSLHNGSNQKETLKNVIDHIDSTIEAIRSIIRNLRPHEFSKVGLAGALKNFCEKIENKFPVQITTQFAGMEERLNDIVEINIFRILQELINNTVKHSGAKNVYLKMNMDSERLFIQYKDDGVGFDPETIIHGMGIGNLQARVNLFDGHMKTDTSPGKGVNYIIQFEKDKLQL